MELISPDTVSYAYATASTMQQRVVSVVLNKIPFLLSAQESDAPEPIVVCRVVGVDAAVDSLFSLILSLEKEYGRAFTRSVLTVLLSRCGAQEVKHVLKQVRSLHEEETEENGG